MERHETDRLAIDAIRTLAMDAVQAANSGHPGTPMALAPLGWLLFSRILRHDPTDPTWHDRDRFILSCGHASMLQYALLHLSGYDLPLDELRNFRQWGSRTPGHPELGHTPGVETTTGPLGQGFANAVGMAMAECHLASRFNRAGHTLFDHRVYVIASDGDLMEGVASEAASLAGHLRLGKIIAYWDDNRITIDGSTDLTFTEEVRGRFEAYGWHTVSVDDGNDLDALERATLAAQADPRPSLIRVRTIIGYPSPNAQNSSKAHGAPLGDDEVAQTKQVMGWTRRPFELPTELAPVRAALRERGAQQSQQWREGCHRYARAFPEASQALDQTLCGDLPAGWNADLPTFAPDPKGMATRKASGAVLTALSSDIPELVGGSADLAGSNNSYIKGRPDFTPIAELGRPPCNVHWGVREHAMAAAINGLALHGGVKPYGATFLVFSDYMRPALRLAALMNLPTRYVFTHDSIGLGEDGPTHQPIEHLASLRAIPNFTVFRPADANETRECWKAALRCKGPAALVLTRQNIPTLDRTRYAPEAGAQRGAYVLCEASEGSPAVILLATGSEVAIALQACEQLEADGVRTRVVSMPSWELFEAQEKAYRDEVLPPGVRARVVVEAGSRFGWERWVGPEGGFVTLDRFGASAPAAELYERFGLTPNRVVETAKALVSHQAR